MVARIKAGNLPPAPKPTLPHGVPSRAVLIDDMYMARHKNRGQGHHWTDEEVREITEMREEGMSWPLIGKEFGVTRETVRKAWTRGQ